jgi:L,D-transpeptidase YcbB
MNVKAPGLRKFAFTFLLGSAGMLNGLPQNNNQPLQANAVPTVAPGPQFAVLKRDLSAMIQVGRLSDLRWRNFSNYRSRLREFYEPTDYSPAWLVGNQPTSQAQAMIQVFRDADKKGLRPGDYDASRWADRLAKLAQSALPDDAARFDLALTVSAIRYISDLHIGRMNPQYFGFGLPVHRRNFKAGEFLRTQVVNSNDVGSALAQMEPPFPAYHRVEAALEHYLELEKQGDGRPIPVPKNSIKPGGPYEGIPQLAERLRLFGDLPKDAVVSDSNVYEGVLVDAVKRCQRRHGLDEDGVLGLETFKQLGKPIKDRVVQLQLALERWRWLPQDVQPPMILVNIPEFHLWAYDDFEKPALSMKVVVGKADEDHKTPVFADRMEYLIFRPYWKVPDSIILREIIPSLAKDPNYLAKHDYEMVDKQGTVIITDAIDAETTNKLATGELDVRQKPGTDNSLGEIKFVFPNSYDVYLHGTPEHQLFGRWRRDFSHGCVRVEDPVSLAFWVMHDPRWTTDRILAAINNEKKDGYQVNLKKALPVLILYSTAAVREDGEVDFYNDFYQEDADLQRALALGYPYPDCCDPKLKDKKPPLIRAAAPQPPATQVSPPAAAPSPQPISPE